MRARRFWLPVFGMCVALLAQRALRAEDPRPAAEKPADKKAEKKEVFLRVLRDDKKEPIALQTSIARYVPAGKEYEGAVVDLIGAVHIGDKSYYDELNKIFEDYDAMLYELVAPEGTKIPKGGARQGANPISGLQRGMQTMLDLEFQLDRIDYTKENFIHADMSPEEFSKSMKDKNESMLSMMFRMMGQSAKTQSGGGGGDAEMLFALFSDDRAHRLKRAMAVQFENLEGQMSAFEGKDGSTIITERNKKALLVLKRELDAGKKKIAIFYGAGHLADMHERLLEEFKLKKDSERWLTAWKMEEPAKKAAPKKEKKPVEAK
jgi:hypothetical protein